jgi:hypothetical protein
MLTYGKGALEGDVVLLHTLDSSVGNGGLSILQDRGNIDGFPLDRGLYLVLVGPLEAPRGLFGR